VTASAVRHEMPQRPLGGGRSATVSPRRKRSSKRRLRILAWVAGIASFLSPLAVLGLTPKPVAGAAPPKPRVIIRHRVVHRVIWQQAPVTSQPRVRYVYASGGGGSVAPVSTGGSHPHP
jgi:hypothetical protein